MADNELSTSIKSHTVRRIYPNGSWANLSSIICNHCLISKDKIHYKPNKYTCIECTKIKLNVESKPPPTTIVQRIYPNGSWNTLDNIVCNKCNIEKPKTENFKRNRYTCNDCIKMEQLENKDKYNQKNKEYAKKYRNSPHGHERERQRLKEYYERKKNQLLLQTNILVQQSIDIDQKQ